MGLVALKLGSGVLNCGGDEKSECVVLLHSAFPAALYTFLN